MHPGDIRGYGDPIFFIYTTTYAITVLGYGQRIGMAANLTVGVIGTIFAVAGGLLADRYGVKAIALVPRLAVTLLLYPALHLIVSSNSPAVFLLVVGALMTQHAMASATAIILIPRAFPASVRTAGLSFAYALGVTLFGGRAQIVFTWIIGATGDKLSWVWYITAMNIVCLLATWAIRVPVERSMQGESSPAKVLAGTSE